jgi:hypothetical protein
MHILKKLAQRNTRLFHRFCMAASVILLLSLLVTPLFADVITEWNMEALDYFKEMNTSNQFANRALAMMHIAMFDATNGIKRQYTPFLFKQRTIHSLPVNAAAAAAAYKVLASLYPNDQMRFETLYNTQLAQIPNSPLLNAAKRYGERAGQAVLNAREDDGSEEAANVPFPDGTELGEWRRTDARPPMLPGWALVSPFTLISNEQFRLIGPPDLTSYEYARDYNEVKTLGAVNSQIRTPEQTTIARFWVSGIPRIWNLIAQRLSAEKGYTLTENARLFALLNVALADANVSGWDMKYHYGFWRPVTAIAYGNSDGNDLTAGDTSWASLIMVPPFPEYISGHSISCGTAATILAKFSGSDSFAFTISSEANPALPQRSFNSFWAAAREAGSSRIYAGLHFNFSNVEGLEAGRSLARYIYENYMGQFNYQ